MNKKTENFYLIDGNALCYRSYYAIRELSNSRGMPTNAILGFLNILRKLIREYDPDMLAVVFDTPAPTERHKKYEAYKIHRKPMPDDLIDQMPKIKEVVDAYNIPMYELDGYEADDIIATLAECASRKGINVTIVTSDKDAMQLVGGNIKVLSSSFAGDKLYGADDVKKKYGVGPEQMVDMMALMGDSSDNVPGVNGVGMVTAGKLVAKYGSVQEIYKNIEDIGSVSLKKKLIEGKEMAELSRELILLNMNVPVKFDLDEVCLKEPDTERLSELYKKFEFNKLLREITPKKEQKEGVYTVERDETNVEKILSSIVKKKLVSLRVVSSSDGEEINGISFSIKEGEASFIPFERARDQIKELLADATVVKIGYDTKKDIRTLSLHNIVMKGEIFDVMIADYLIDPARPKYELADIAMRQLEYNLEGTGAAGWDGIGQGTMDFTGENSFKAECEQSDITLRLFNSMSPILKTKKLDGLFYDVEMPLVRVLADMEDEGVGVDVVTLRKMSREIEERLKEATKVIYTLAGEEFNINSPKQLQGILFDKMNMPILKKTKTGPSTDESVLRRLAVKNELPREILTYRAMNKLKTGYYDSILTLVDPSTKKVHANFNQAVTATGRLSSSEPNLQNIPIKTPMGKEIRRVFVPSKKDDLLLAADYSQVELRILAHLAADKTLIEAFKKEEDIHCLTASLMFDCDLSAVTEEMRSNAKTVNFGIIYGMSSFGLAKELGVRVEEAQRFIDAYFERYDGVKVFISETIEKAKKDGFVTTLLNRRRYVPELKSKNERVRGFAERVAVNTPVQGTAADLIKLAMIDAHEKFRNTDVKMIIQVHDELVFTVPKNSLKKTVKDVRGIMEGVIKLKVPLKVDIACGNNWLNMEEV